jgi:hypothetical protein
VPRATYATLKMLGYSRKGGGIPRQMSWGAGEIGAGIRIPRGKNPSSTLFHDGQRVVIYDSQERTVPSYGRFVGSVYDVEPPEHGCHLAIKYRADGGIGAVSTAPKFHALVDLRTAQGSYRGLHREEYERLVAAIQAHHGHQAY